MCRSMVVLGVMVVLFAGGAARAEVPPQGEGPALGLRVGFGLPQGLLQGGDGHRDAPMSEIVTGIIPAQLDVGYFFNIGDSRIYLGGSFQYAWGLLSRPCVEGSGCDPRDLRVGVNVSYHLPWSGTLSPWLGLGVGTDFFAPSQAPRVVDGEIHQADKVFMGLEFFNVQGGADLNVHGPVWLGPFATFTMGKYVNVNDDAYHLWLIGGLRLHVRL